MKSIRTRLVSSYLTVIFVVACLFEMFLIIGTNSYYYNRTERLLINQAKISGQFYNSYFNYNDIYTDTGEILKTFSVNSPVLVQILDLQGNVLRDSSGFWTDEKVNTDDYKAALAGKVYVYTGQNSAEKERIMAVSYPINLGGRHVGVVRFVTSLSDVDKTVFILEVIFAVMGIIAVLIALTISLLMAKTIIVPLRLITDAAEKMKKGNFDQRIVVPNNDEIGILGNTLNTMAEEILKNEKLKNDFISSISHELRTPLTSIAGWAETIEGSDFSEEEEIRTGINIISKESKRLTKLVEELLDFSRLEAGRIKIRFDDVNILSVIDEIEKQAVPKAKRHGVEIIVDADESLPLIKGDTDRLKQVFVNILDNAIKFTRAGGTIKISTEKTEKYINVVVEDDGCGIPASELPRVKEKFYKGSNKASGSGIGLAICDEIMNLHGGSMEVQSVEGKGTKVILSIALAAVEKVKI